MCFHSKVVIKDGKDFSDNLGLRYNKWQRYGEFSAISYGNNLFFGLPILTLIPTFIIYILIIIAFKINTPITHKILFNPLFLIIFIFVFCFMFPKFRKWERGFVMNLKDDIWKEI